MDWKIVRGKVGRIGEMGKEEGRVRDGRGDGKGERIERHHHY